MPLKWPDSKEEQKKGRMWMYICNHIQNSSSGKELFSCKHMRMYMDTLTTPKQCPYTWRQVFESPKASTAQLASHSSSPQLLTLLLRSPGCSHPAFRWPPPRKQLWKHCIGKPWKLPKVWWKKLLSIGVPPQQSHLQPATHSNIPLDNIWTPHYGGPSERLSPM